MKKIPYSEYSFTVKIKRTRPERKTLPYNVKGYVLLYDDGEGNIGATWEGTMDNIVNSNVLNANLAYQIYAGSLTSKEDAKE